MTQVSPIGLAIAIIIGFSYLPIAYAQLNECTIFDGKILVVIRATGDCLGYADAKMAADGWKFIQIYNESIYMEKNGNNTQEFR